MTTAQRLDAALEHLRAIGHAHEADEPTRQHIEFAAGHVRQARIADDGQRATTPEETHKAVRAFFKLEALAKARTTPARA